MKCEDARELLAMYLYGELAAAEEEACEAHVHECQACRSELDRQNRLHRLLDGQTEVPPEGMLTASRLELRTRLAADQQPHGLSAWLRNTFSFHVRAAPAWVQGVAAVALVVAGFAGGRVTPWGGAASAGMYGTPMTSEVQYVEPENSGRVQIVLDETRQRVITGSTRDSPIRDLLVKATRQAGNPAVRVRSVELLRNDCGSSPIRDVFLGALQHDPDPGVRLVVLDALKDFAWDPHTRDILSQVLLADRNASVRTEVINVLVQQKQDANVGVFQDLMRQEPDVYIRQQCGKALRAMKASAEEY